MVRATGRALGSTAEKYVFRAGATSDQEILPYTSLGLLQSRDPETATVVKQAESKLRQLTANLPMLLKKDGNEKVFEAIQWCKDIVRAFAEHAKSFSETLAEKSQCVATTLAALVLKPSQ